MPLAQTASVRGARDHCGPARRVSRHARCTGRLHAIRCPRSASVSLARPGRRHGVQQLGHFPVRGAGRERRRQRLVGGERRRLGFRGKRRGGGVEWRVRVGWRGAGLRARLGLPDPRGLLRLRGRAPRRESAELQRAVRTGCVQRGRRHLGSLRRRPVCHPLELSRAADADAVRPHAAGVRARRASGERQLRRPVLHRRVRGRHALRQGTGLRRLWSGRLLRRGRRHLGSSGRLELGESSLPAAAGGLRRCRLVRLLERVRRLRGVFGAPERGEVYGGRAVNSTAAAVGITCARPRRDRPRAPARAPGSRAGTGLLRRPGRTPCRASPRRGSRPS